MRVERLELTNFRGIRQLTLEFPTQATVLVGINGVGKSAVLDALAFMLGRIVDRLRPHSLSTPRLRSKDLRNEAQEVRLSITAMEGGGLFPWVIAAQRSFDAGLNAHAVEILGLEQYLQILQDRFARDSSAPLPLLVQYSTNRGQWTDVHGKPQPETPGPRETEQVLTYKKAFPAEPGVFETFYGWFREREDIENEARARGQPDFVDPQLAAVRSAVEALMQGFSNLRIERKLHQMVVQKDGEALDVAQLSSGEKALLTLVADLARRLSRANPENPNPRSGEGVVLIDEVDLHLHPRWQRRVLPALERTFPNCQFIVTTHSPQVLSEVRPESIYLLERREGETVATRPEASFGLDSNRILEDLMGVDERPRRIKEKLTVFFRLIDEGKLDEAKGLRRELEAEIGSDEPNFAKADVLIRRKEMLAGATPRPQR